MALEKVSAHDRHTITASVDLSAKQYCFVTLAGAVAGAGALGFPLMDNPVSGDAGTIAIGGAPKVVAGGTISQGAFLASDASGHAVAAATGNEILGIALKAAASGDVVQILFRPSGAKA